MIYSRGRGLQFRRTFFLLAAVYGVWAQTQTITPGGPPVFGSQTPDNKYTAKFTLVYKLDPAGQAAALTAQSPGVTVTSDPALVVGGTSSVRLSGSNASFLLPAGQLTLQPNRIYLISYQFRIISNGGSSATASVIFSLPGTGVTPIGPSPLTLNETAGATAAGLLLGSQPGAAVGFSSSQADIVIGNIQVFREDVQVSRASVPLWHEGFPRLALYNLTTPEDTAARTGLPLSQVDQLLSQYDVILGTDIDQTLGTGGWVSRLRTLNPNLRILPYKNSFMADFTPLSIVGDSANLMGTFNRGLAPSWFMVTPAGQRLNEPDYPLLYQMDHTSYCPLVNSLSFTDYTRLFMAESVLPSGLWDGVHFDQPEWYPNPLLVPKAAGPLAPLPAIDLTRTGQAASVVQLYQAWNAAFPAYFQKMSSVFGFTNLMFGNPGYIPHNNQVLPYLNGWLREIVSPYTIGPTGNWDTTGASGWYRLSGNYIFASTLARAPQMVTLQFTGMGLGTSTGTYTANGLANRTATLEPRDFQRMRLGLTTALLANGFFDYALVDNTTAPVWFDEYSVGSNGVATGDASQKGYLGQPLEDALELPYNYQPLLLVDFESPVNPLLTLGPNTHMSANASEVISGNASLVATLSSSSQSGLVFTTNPATLPLQPGTTYQLLVDYKILTYNPSIFQGFFGVSIYNPNTGLTDPDTDSLFQPDVAGVGQQGTLRASVKVSGSGFSVSGYLLDTGSVAIDNIRLLQATGGIWRRDFENGIVLVNPTPEAITVSAQDIAGPRSRQNIRRILGTQSPSWNNGQAVQSLTIPSGDGIILLANPIPSQTLSTPTGFSTNPTSDGGVYVNWQRNAEYAAGYYIAYGEDPLELDHMAATGPLPGVELQNVQPGVTYSYRIAAYDFLGNLGPLSPSQTFTAPGTAQNRPTFALGPQTLALAPGSIAELVGSGLTPESGGTVSVLVNGVKAPSESTSAGGISFVTPWEISGGTAVIQVVRDGIMSADYIASVQSSAPILPTDASGNVLATFANRSAAIRNGNTAVPGLTVSVQAAGLGAVEPPPVDGTLPTTPSVVLGNVQVTLAGTPVTVLSATLSQSMLGMYDVELIVPPGLPAGPQSLVISCNGRNSNPGTLLIGSDPPRKPAAM